MRSGVLVLGLLLGGSAAGCGFRSPPGTFDDAGTREGPDGCASFAMLLDTCALAFDGDLMVTGMSSYDTGSHELKIGGTVTPWPYRTIKIGGDDVDVIAASTVQLATSAILRGSGPRALAIVASDSIVIATDAQIDVSAGGAGMQTACANPAMPGQASSGSNDGGSGGGGGGFGADGGDGGDGNHDATETVGGMKGHAVATLPGGLHGGCAGARGGNGDDMGGAGGQGGGALYVVAARRIQLDSTAPLNAGGGGGRGGQHNNLTGGDAGGGGGGSGGMLVLQAPHIVGPTATIAANGGGGGEGSESSNAGADGFPGSVTTSRANGGSGMANTGGDGGRGGSAEVSGGESVVSQPSGGGGGGGGGVGIIRILSDDVQLAAASPEPS